jgi:hypothetical protein
MNLLYLGPLSVLVILSLMCLSYYYDQRSKKLKEFREHGIFGVIITGSPYYQKSENCINLGKLLTTLLVLTYCISLLLWALGLN